MKKKSAVKLFAGFLAASLLFSAVSPEGISLLVSATDGTSNDVACVTVGGVTTNYTDFTKAWDAAKEAKTAKVELLSDVKVHYRDLFSDHPPFIVENGEDITFDGGNYTLSYEDSDFSVTGFGTFNIRYGGKLTVEGGNISAVSYNNNEVNNNIKQSCFSVEGGMLEINDGTFTSNYDALKFVSGNAQLKGGKYICGNGFHAILKNNMEESISDLLGNYGNYAADEHYAFKGNSGIYGSDKLSANKSNQNETVEIIKCNHGGQQLGHGDVCEYCGGMPVPHTYGDDGKCTGCSSEPKVLVTVNGKTAGYETIWEAWNVAVKSGKAVIDLRADTETNDTLVLNSADIILKSNDNNTVTINNGGDPLIHAYSGNLTINGGKFSGTKGLFVSGGNVELCGGTFTGTEYAIKSEELCLGELTGKEGYAYYDDNGNVITGILKNKSIDQTVTVKKCDHSNKGITDIGIGHIEGCPHCGMTFSESEPHSWTDDNSCSICNAKAVAELGGVKYTLLKSALDKNLGDGEITLLNNTVVDEPLVIDGNKTINGNGKTIAFKYSDRDYFAGAITVPEGSDLTLNHVNVKMEDGYFISTIISNSGKLNIIQCNISNSSESCGITSSGGIIELTNSEVYGIDYGLNLRECTIKITNCTVASAPNKQYGLYYDGYVNAEIKNCNISGKIGIGGFSIGNKFVIDGGTITGTNTGIFIENDAEFVITGGCEIKINTSVSASDTKGIYIKPARSVSLENCSITGFTNAINTYNGDNPVNKYLAKNCYCWDSAKEIITETSVQTITGDIFIHPCTHGNNSFTFEDDTHSGSCNICGKTANKEPHTYSHSGECTVCGSTALIEINDGGVISYARTLSKAFTSGSSNATITLLNDITLSKEITIPDGAMFTLDLNGNNIGGEGAISGNDTNLTVRSSKGGKIDCDISVLSLIAGGNSKLGKVSANFVNVDNENVEIRELIVKGNTLLRCGKYGSITVTGENTTLGSILAVDPSTYYAYYNAEGNPIEGILDAKKVENVTVKPCTHAYEYPSESISVDSHTKNCKYCNYNGVNEQHSFIVADTQVRSEKRTVSGVCECGAARVFTLDKNTYTYDGKAKEPVVTGKITYGEKTQDLAVNNDYQVEYTNNTNAGLGEVQVAGENYDGTDFTYVLLFEIKKAEKPSVMPENKMNAYLEHEKVGSIALPENWEWSSEDKETALEVGKTVTATAQYVGADKDNYKNIEVKIEITRSEGSQPSETEPSETEPSETEPNETEPSETEPNETEPSETQPSETEPSETQPSETQPSETEPSETEPSETQPSETEPSETQPIIPLPIIPQPSDPQPSEPQPSNPQPSEPEAEKPYIEGDNGKSGWEVIREEAETAENGNEVTVEMNGATEVPVDVLKSVKDKDVTLTFDMSEGISWSINGADITEQIENIDLGVTVGSNAIPEDVVNDVAGENYSVQLSLSYDGEFGFAATLSVDMGKEKAGYYASLFYYNEQSGKPEFITESKITEDGAAKLKFTHASEYIIVVNEKSRFDEDPSITESSSDNSGDNSPSSESENVNTTDNGSDNSTSSTTDGESSGENNPNTGDNSAQTAIWFAAFGVLTSVTGAFIFTRRKKNINR